MGVVIRDGGRIRGRGCCAKEMNEMARERDEGAGRGMGGAKIKSVKTVR